MTLSSRTPPWRVNRGGNSLVDVPPWRGSLTHFEALLYNSGCAVQPSVVFIKGQSNAMCRLPGRKDIISRSFTPYNAFIPQTMMQCVLL